MNNEEKILSMLERITDDVSELKTGQRRIEARLDNLESKVDNLETKVDNLESKVDNLDVRVCNLEDKVVEMSKRVEIIFDETANLRVFKTAISEKVDQFVNVAKENTVDIYRLKLAK
jgi:peptidoglycan hydrolase CwlO-like protein